MLWLGFFIIFSSNKKMLNKIFFIFLVLITVWLSILLIQLISNEFARNNSAISCNWIITDSETEKITQGSIRRSSINYQCIQKVSTEASYKWEIVTRLDKEDLESFTEDCRKKIGKEISWYYYNWEFRNIKIIFQNIIWVSILLVIFLGITISICRKNKIKKDIISN